MSHPKVKGEKVFAWTPLQITKPAIIHSQTSTQICGMSKACKPTVHVMGGLTRVNLPTKPKYFNTEAEAIKSKHPSKILFYYKPIRYDIKFDWVKIWLAKELKKGSCPYRAVLTHEKKHVEIAHNVLRQYAQRLERALNQAKIPTKGAPLEIVDSASSFNSTVSKYDQMIKRIFTTHYISTGKFQQIYNDIDIAWNRLDSKQEYNRVRKSCLPSSWPI